MCIRTFCNSKYYKYVKVTSIKVKCLLKRKKKINLTKNDTLMALVIYTKEETRASLINNLDEKEPPNQK